VHVAKHSGPVGYFNPWEIPVYEWTDSGPVERKLTSFTRTPLKTIYLTREGESVMHMVNDPFDYEKLKA